MIEYIHIYNIALIEEVHICFNNGLNILSGETGAGKSMIVNSINFLFGQRQKKDFINKNKKSAYVDGLFFIKNNYIVNEIESLGITIPENNKILIRHNINTNGKHNYTANTTEINLTTLKILYNLLIDIHSQHDNHYLFDDNNHISFLDIFCGKELDKLKLELQNSLKQYKYTVSSINSITGETDIDARVESLKFQIEEIEKSNITIDEENILTNRMNTLATHSKLYENIAECLNYLDESDYTNISTVEKINKSLSLIKELAKYDETQKPIYESLENISIVLTETCRDLRNYSDNLVYNPDELTQIQTRLNFIYNMKKKYNGSVANMIEYYENIQSELNLILNSEFELEKLNKEKIEIINKISSYCKKISNLRQKSSSLIKDQMENILHDLGMPDAKFDVSITRKEKFTSNGYDNVKFLISTNAGSRLTDISRVASGGEMSRIMLAFKTILASYDNIETFIFDEIDTGISGRTAQKVAENLSNLSKHHQILCITHLSQIAAMSDRHFLIKKSSAEGKTVTDVHQLDEEGTIKELARLIGGVVITNKTLETAKEMKHQATEIKSKS